MEAIENLIFGDPVYDCKGRVVRRNFGIKNALVIILIVYGLYSLRGKMAIKSGRRKLRGGSESSNTPPQTTSSNNNQNFMKKFAVFIAVALVIAYSFFRVVYIEGELDLF